MTAEEEPRPQPPQPLQPRQSPRPPQQQPQQQQQQQQQKGGGHQDEKKEEEEVTAEEESQPQPPPLTSPPQQQPQQKQQQRQQRQQLKLTPPPPSKPPPPPPLPAKRKETSGDGTSTDGKAHKGVALCGRLYWCAGERVIRKRVRMARGAGKGESVVESGEYHGGKRRRRPKRERWREKQTIVTTGWSQLFEFVLVYSLFASLTCMSHIVRRSF